MQPLAPVTIKHVARKAGVSIATVSRVLNNPEKVRVDVVLRVQAAAAVLRYVPHRGARSLVSRRFGAMGALIPTLENPIFAKATQALQSRLSEHGYRLLLASTECDPAFEYSQLESLIAHGVDGVMLVGASHDPKVQSLLTSKGVPHLNTWVYDSSTDVPCIGFDNKLAMVQVVSYLYDMGHRQFAMIGGLIAHNDRAFDRIVGVKEALESRGLSIPAGSLITRPYTFADGRSAFSILMSQPVRPTAVICGNDILALGALFEAVSRGMSIPKELSITGFDDLDLAAQSVPAMTSVRVPASQMGARAAECLVALRAGKEPDLRQRLEAPLIVRGTTGPAFSA
jgi:LacI family transcriptional regulator